MKHFSDAKNKLGLRIVACSAAFCLGVSLFPLSAKHFSAYAEQPDCSYEHAHKIVTGAVTGDEYEVGDRFGSDIAFEAPKVPYGEEIIVDGFRDDIWDEYEEYAITTLVGTDQWGNWKNSRVTGKVQYMWDDGCLYVWVEIYDPELNIGRSGAQGYGDSKGDNLEFYIDTLHTDELVDYNFSDGLYAWDGCDGGAYRGGNYDYEIDPSGDWVASNLRNKDNETTAGMAIDGGNYQDAAVGKFRISGGANQTTGDYDYRDNKINSFVDASGNRDAFGSLTDRRGNGDGNRVEWAPYTWLSSWDQWDGDSNFTSAYIFDDWDIHEPYERGLTTNLDLAEQEYNSLKSEIGGGRDAIGFTFEAMFEFKSEMYEPTDGSIIGVGISYEDWKLDDNGWLGGYRGTFGLENNGSCSYEYVRVAPLNLSHLVLLPGEDNRNGPYADQNNYTVNFLDGTQTIYSWTGKKGDVVPTPPSPTKEGYIFEGWTGFSNGYTINGNKNFRAKWSAVINELNGELPTADSYQDPDWTSLSDNTELAVYQGERTSAPIEVDGNFDNAYLEAEPILLTDNYEGADTDVWGIAYFVYDNQYFYVFVVVYDEDVMTNGPRGFSDSADGYAGLEARWDNVTLYVDTYNKPSGLHQGMGGEYRGEYEGEGRFRLNAGDMPYSTSNGGFSPSYHPMGWEPWMMNDASLVKQGASQVIEGVGYTAEFKIGWASFNGAAADGKQIAFAIVITDGDGSLSYQNTAKVSDTWHYNPDWEVGSYSKLELDDRVEPEITVHYPSNEYYEPFKSSSAGTGNGSGNNNTDEPKKKKGCKGAIGLGSGVVLVATLGAGAIVLMKKKKSE